MALVVLLAVQPTWAQQDAIEYAENGEGSVATFTADDPDGDDVAWSLDGDDAGDFTIEGGVLEFMSPPNYEMPTGGGANGTSNHLLRDGGRHRRRRLSPDG